MSRIAYLQRKGLLAVFLLIWPWWLHAQPTVATSVPKDGVRIISNEAFQRWLKEDTEVVNGILATLTHIDTLLADIERMIRQLPDFASVSAPMPAPPPVVSEKNIDKEEPDTSESWLTRLSTVTLVALLAFWLGRKLGAKRQASTPATSTSTSSVPDDSLKKTRSSRTPTAAVTAPPSPSAKAEISYPPPAAPVYRVSQTTSIEPALSSIEAPAASETDQAIELAEIMLSMGLGHGAAQTLVEKIRSEPKQALRHWLKLLEIYRKNGQQAEFERSAEELRLHFNVRPEDWHLQPGKQRTLEDFPHITQRLTKLWGTSECLLYIQNLLADNRGGARSGFPQTVAEELLLLVNIMRLAYFS